MRYYSIGEFANKIGKTIQTLRNWDKNGTLKPSHITVAGTRYYSQEQLNNFLGLKSKIKQNKNTIGYCRYTINVTATSGTLNGTFSLAKVEKQTEFQS